MPVKLSDYVADFIAGLGTKAVFSVTGGGAMHLNDSIGSHPDFEFVPTHHEQAAAMAAEGYARAANTIGVVHVTTGPGGTNAMTGIAGAWIDSIPILAISGQVPIHNSIGQSALRQLGVQEVDIVKMVEPITKYAVMVTEPQMIRHHLEKAVHLATTGRPGPVWLDIPLETQNAIIPDPDTLPTYIPEPPLRRRGAANMHLQVDQAIEMLATAERPVVIAGNGIRLAGASEAFRTLIDRLQVPVISSWNASDLMPSDHPLYIGRPGLFGDRAGNYTMQNADLLFILGSRMSIPMIGYTPELLAPNARVIYVDIDEAELSKPTLRTHLPVAADAKVFTEAMLARLGNFERNEKVGGWLKRCRDWVEKYPMVLDEYRELERQVNSFHFTEVLADKLPEGSVVVTDMGTSFTCTMQTFKLKENQRLFTSSGLAAMGFGLPGAIGACYGHGKQRTIMLAGDGGMMFNLQELQTVKQLNLPITMFVLANEGYLTMKHMQVAAFDRYVGSHPDSNVSCPDFVKVADAIGIPGTHIRTADEMVARMDEILAHDGPYLVEVEMPAMQLLIPRVQTKRDKDGNFLPTPIEDMFPYLPDEEQQANMANETTDMVSK
ncbi:MAG: thiamine pyrophosphate-binding protein [Rhodospirillaceae bacterium]|jgi:acetolactate synthase I/II/III large subunit|nr:thiamine pyrophosphate-binding protein [Rhodospirillaceae bacterium]MBT6137276.1 thiamine pyrophosphate-binding protein [Rhodospirillaceae bacterium]